MAKINYWHKFEEDGFYHIYNRGINGTNIFIQEQNYFFFLQKWKTLIYPFFDTLSYCLMPNHFHFLVKVKPLNNEIERTIQSLNTSKSNKFLNKEITYNDFLEDQFKRLFSSYALAFNKQENRTGSLFQKRFKRIGVSNDTKLLYLIAYIHHNPIHHNFTNNYEGWSFSSYKAYVSQSNTLIAKNIILKELNNDKLLAITEFIKYHQEFKFDKEIEYSNQ